MRQPPLLPELLGSRTATSLLLEETPREKPSCTPNGKTREMEKKRARTKVGVVGTAT